MSKPGRQARADALALLTTSWPVTSEIEGRDRYQWLLATCRANGKDIGREMVRQGMALAYRQYSDRYVTDEEYACRERLPVRRYDPSG